MLKTVEVVLQDLDIWWGFGVGVCLGNALREGDIQEGEVALPAYAEVVQVNCFLGKVCEGEMQKTLAGHVRRVRVGDLQSAAGG